MPRPTSLSVLVPVFNERVTIERLLNEVVAVETALRVEVLVGDDGSSDGTRDILSRLALPGVRVIFMSENVGRGGVLKHLWTLATGDIYIHQDADLEYDPRDYVAMLELLMSGKSDIVYGSRYLARGRYPNQSLAAYLGGRSLSLIARLFTGRYLTDTVTALKLFERRDIAALPLETTGFELDHEITARMLARGKRIEEVPIRYYPRTRAEGKKIGLRDWFIALRTFWRYRRSA